MKDSSHMSYFRVGSVYVLKTFLLTIIGIILIILWVQAVIISKIDKNITENKLVTTGAYA
ncbi:MULTISPECIES: hypothetical protein [Clostridium]|uniref:hypothetical protein n=1 Tax=Clostridium TaxID=1485 RepID=UPI000A996604|nr:MULTISPECIES: hypothetical protein [Clostridium]MCD2348319.1 hypothetical protein [Clostridium guangxiense]